MVVMLLGSIKTNKLTELPDHFISQTFDIIFDVELKITHPDVVVLETDGGSKDMVVQAVAEYMFHVKTETNDYQLVHIADKIVFAGDVIRSFNYIVSLDLDERNILNVLVGI